MSKPTLQRYYDYMQASFLDADMDHLERAVYDLWTDVTDRRGWRQEADQFDDDIKDEIMATWYEILKELE